MTGVNVTGNVCSKANPEEKARIQELSMLQSESNKLSVCAVLSKEAKFPELQYSCGFALDDSKQILVITQCHHILMQKLENGIAPGEPEVYPLVLILHATVLLNAVILLTHLARNRSLYALILQIPIECWILSLITLINSW